MTDPSRRPAPPHAPPSAVLAAADDLLAHCQHFVQLVADEHFARDSALMPGGSLGKHLRHLLDHYLALFVALDAMGPVMYDRRERNVPMETQRSAALDAITDLRARLKSTPHDLLDKPLTVRVMLSGDGTEAQLRSSLARELAFATHHAVHHQAMIRVIAGEFGVHASPDFGKAPSTLHFEHASTPAR